METDVGSSRWSSSCCCWNRLPERPRNRRRRILSQILTQEFSFPLVPRSTFQSCGWWCTKGKGKVNRYLSQHCWSWNSLPSASLEFWDVAQILRNNLLLSPFTSHLWKKSKKSRLLAFLSLLCFQHLEIRNLKGLKNLSSKDLLPQRAVSKKYFRDEG